MYINITMEYKSTNWSQNSDTSLYYWPWAASFFFICFFRFLITRKCFHIGSMSECCGQSSDTSPRPGSRQASFCQHKEREQPAYCYLQQQEQHQILEIKLINSCHQFHMISINISEEVISFLGDAHLKLLGLSLLTVSMYILQKKSTLSTKINYVS